jgi:hypothetical protein
MSVTGAKEFKFIYLVVLSLYQIMQPTWITNTVTTDPLLTCYGLLGHPYGHCFIVCNCVKVYFTVLFTFFTCYVRLCVNDVER